MWGSYAAMRRLSNPLKRRRLQESDDDQESVTSDGSGSNPLAELLGQMFQPQQTSNRPIFTTDNHVYFYSEVTRMSALQLIRELKTLSTKLVIESVKSNTTPPEIYLHINSEGGSIFDGLAVVDAILESPVPVVTIVEGMAASAATLISVVGARRLIKPNAHMLVHQLSTTMWGKMSELMDEMHNCTHLMGMIKRIYSKYTKIPSKKIDEILKHDLYWSAEECLRYHLVDEVIDPKSFHLVHFAAAKTQ